MTLQTDRLVLRPVEAGDWERILAISSRPGVREHLLPGQASEAYVKRWVEQSVAHTRMLSPLHFAFMILARHGEGVPIGLCALTVVHKTRRVANLGWDVCPDHAGNGYATEAASELVRLGFGPCRLRRLRSDCYSDNAGSRRVMEKVGLKEKRTAWTRLTLWWSYPDTQQKVRYETTRDAWLRGVVRPS